jgi:hypothetical membrane protein
MQDFKSEVLLSEEKKAEVLMHALGERYSAIRAIRDRVQNVCLWVLGLFVTGAGWLLQATNPLDCSEKIFFTSMILIAVFVLRAYYLKDLEKGFKNQQQTQARIESALGLCTEGVFIDCSIYPAEWGNAGTKKGKGNFFAHNYLLIYTGTLFLIMSIWLK